MPCRSTAEGTEAKEDFTGHERDRATGLHYAGARYYMAAFGRWTTTDPLSDEYPSVSPYNYSLNNPVNLVDPDGMAPQDWYLNNETGDITWINGSGPQEGYTHLGEDITFTFNSYIDSETWDGPLLGSIVGGDKLTTSVTLDATTGEGGSLESIDVSFGDVEIGKTAGIMPGQEGVPGTSTIRFARDGAPSRLSVLQEQHTMVHSWEAVGLDLMGYETVNVAQSLAIVNNDGTLGISASTDVFPSATLDVRGTGGSARLFKYPQPSFVKTHAEGKRPPFRFYQRYSSGR